MLPLNPYRLSPVFQEGEFFGRQPTLGMLKTAMAASRSVQLVGQFRIGTTSVLRYIKAHPKEFFADQKAIVIYWDLTSRTRPRNSDDFFSQMLKFMSQALVRRGEIQAMIDSEMDTSDPFLFHDYTARWVENEGYSVFFLLDEFGVIASDESFGTDFYDNIRSTIPTISYVLTSPRSLDYYSSGELHSSPLWNALQLFTLGLFEDYETIQQLIRIPAKRVGLQWADYAENFIYDRGGQHPYFIQLAASSLYDTYQINQGRLDLNMADNIFRETANQQFRYFLLNTLDDRSRPERQALLQSALINLLNEQKISEDLAQDLRSRSFIWFDPNSNNWRLLSTYFANWLRNWFTTSSKFTNMDNSIPVFTKVRKMKILFLAANPVGTTRLRLDEESRAIDQVLRQAEFRDRFEIRQHWAVRVSDIQELLLRHKPDIVHFSGHGSPSSEIILEDSFGEAHSVSTRALSQLFNVLKDNIQCVVLNACYSEQQAQAIAQYIDCVVGMSKAVGDLAAIGFAAAFYQALGFGRNVKTAFDLGCLQIDLEKLDEQDTPKLIAINSNPEDIMFV